MKKEEEPVSHTPAESQRPCRNLFENHHTVMLLIDPQSGEIVDANPAAVEFYGYTREEFQRLKITDINILSPEQVKEEMARAHSGQKPFFEFQHRRANGEVCHVDVYSDPVQLGDKELLFSVIHDATLRKQTEESLRLSEERFRLAMEATSDGLYDANMVTGERYFSPAYFTMLGYEPNEFPMTTEAWLELMHPDDRERLIQQTEDYAENRSEVMESVYRLRTKSGEWKWILGRGKAVSRDENGRATRIVGTHMDITARKLDEALIQQKSQELDLFFDVALDLLAIADTNGYFHRLNRAWEQTLGYALDELQGKRFLDYIHPEDIQKTLDAMAQLSEQKPVFNFINRYRCKDGSYRWIEWRSAPVGSMIYAAARDITNRIHTEEELRKANEKLTATVRLLEQRSHEDKLIRQVDDLLQACNATEEAYVVIQQYAPLILPSSSGALYLINNSRRTAEVATTWGDNLQSEPVFAVDDCWTLRRGQMHQYQSNAPGLRCRHIPPSFSGQYLGIPLLASGELMGALHIQSAQSDWIHERAIELAQTIGEHISLSIANIRLRETLHAQSIRDALTGLFNRRYMEETLEREIFRAARKKTSVGVIMMDIDHFKHYNDTYGHEAGDAVLHDLGALLQKVVRRSDIACRYGGEEFFLILPEATVETSRQRAEEIRAAVKNLRVEFRRQVMEPLSVSLGVAVFPEHGDRGEILLSRADQALYQAKHKGRDRVEVAE